MSTEAGSASDGYLYACSYKQLEEDNRVCLVIQDKALILIRATKRDGSSQVYAMDGLCYHMGGSLASGDIEDMGDAFGHVIVCPWHKYRIALKSGEGLFRNLQGEWKSKGLKQRTYPVELRTVPGKDSPDVYVNISTEGSDPIASDEYMDRSYLIEEFRSAHCSLASSCDRSVSQGSRP